MHFEARFSAVGGQGIILAGTIIADAAFLEGKHAAGSPTYTAQVRGGPTKVDVIVDDEPILFPRTSEIDFFLSLATRSYNRFGADIKQGTPVVIDPNLVTIPPEHEDKYRIVRVPIIELTSSELGRMVYTSAVALGTMVALVDVIGEDSVRAALKRRAPKGTETYNLQALEVGINATREILAAMS
ncbi:MAG: hypothetical protein MAG453_00081 [Calditrichaeota bacterium]|nr:hypothetical protein [Calditrichota bacterium]